MKKFVFVLAVVAAMTLSSVAVAQMTSYDIRSGMVVSVYGNNLVVRENGVNKEYEVPEDFRFDIDGRSLSVDQLKPGMILTATVKTTTTPQVVYNEEVKKGQVLKVVGRTVVVRTEEGTKTFRDVPSDFIFMVDGQEKTVYDLREGMNLSATIISEQRAEITTREVGVTGTNAARVAVAKKVVEKKVEEAKDTGSAYLPATASRLPLAGLAGLLLLAISVGIAVTRRFV
jgi:opacity protein-like surface antigen